MVNLSTVACRISPRLKWYKNYKNRLRLAKVIVKNKMSRFLWFTVYIGYGHLCVCLSVCPSPHSHTTARTRCPLVVHYWADLQSVHESRCYDNTRMQAYSLTHCKCVQRRTWNVSECLYSLYGRLSNVLQKSVHHAVQESKKRHGCHLLSVCVPVSTWHKCRVTKSETSVTM